MEAPIITPGSGHVPPFKLGKKAKRIRFGLPSLSDFTLGAHSWPVVKPIGWEYAKLLGGLQLLGNDVRSNCAECAAAHYIQTSTANTDNPLYCTYEQVMQVYHDVTGFDPSKDTILADGSIDNPTDQGTCYDDLFTYWMHNGIECTDKTGKKVIHTIIGVAALDITSVPQMRYAAATFGGELLGIECRENFIQNTNDWQWVPKSPKVGGHAINGEGEGSEGTHIQSWGLNIPTSWVALLNTLDEGYIVVTPFWLNNTKVAPSGLNLDALVAVMNAFKKASPQENA